MGASHPDEAVMDVAYSLDAYQKVLHPFVHEPFAELTVLKQQRIGNEGGCKADIAAIPDQLENAGIDSGLSPLDIDGVVPIIVDQGPADGLCLVKPHKSLLRMVV